MNSVNIDIEYMLSLIEERSILWDTRRSDYKNKNLTDAGWHEVCANLIQHFESYDNNFKATMCRLVKGKWSNLRDSWIKHMKKRMQPDCKLTRNYTYHDQLLFLHNVYQFEVIGDNIYGTENFCDIFIKEEPSSGDENDSQANSVIYYAEPEITPSISVKRRIEEVDETSEEEIKLEGENRHLSFFKAILPSLNELSDDQTIEFQIGVLEHIRRMKQKK